MSASRTDSPFTAARWRHLLSRGADACGALVMTVRRRPTARLAVRAAGLTAGDHLVDVGCGPGTAVREAAPRVAAATGVDPNVVSLALARRIARSARSATRPNGAGEVTWLEGRAELLPLPDGRATVAWSLSSVHHWDDRAAGFGEIRRILAPGGRLLIAERLIAPGARHAAHGFTREQAEAVAAELAAAGFTGVQVQADRAGRRGVIVIKADRG